MCKNHNAMMEALRLCILNAQMTRTLAKCHVQMHWCQQTLNILFVGKYIIFGKKKHGVKLCMWMHMGDVLESLHIHATMWKTLSHMLTCMIISLLCCRHIHDSRSLCAFTDCCITFPCVISINSHD